jgi:hypothetical protein
VARRQSGSAFEHLLSCETACPSPRRSRRRPCIASYGPLALPRPQRRPDHRPRRRNLTFRRPTRNSPLVCSSLLRRPLPRSAASRISSMVFARVARPIAAAAARLASVSRPAWRPFVRSSCHQSRLARDDEARSRGDRQDGPRRRPRQSDYSHRARAGLVTHRVRYPAPERCLACVVYQD